MWSLTGCTTCPPQQSSRRGGLFPPLIQTHFIMQLSCNLTVYVCGFFWSSGSCAFRPRTVTTASPFAPMLDSRGFFSHAHLLVRSLNMIVASNFLHTPHACCSHTLFRCFATYNELAVVGIGYSTWAFAALANRTHLTEALSRQKRQSDGDQTCRHFTTILPQCGDIVPVHLRTLFLHSSAAHIFGFWGRLGLRGSSWSHLTSPFLMSYHLIYMSQEAPYTSRCLGDFPIFGWFCNLLREIRLFCFLTVLFRLSSQKQLIQASKVFM